MKPFQFRIESTSHKFSQNEVPFPKRNYSSTEMNSGDQPPNHSRPNKLQYPELGSVTGVGINDLMKMKGSFLLKDKTQKLLSPAKKIMKTKQKLQEIKKTNSTQTDNEQSLQQLKSKTNPVQKLKTLPKIENSSISMFKKPLLTSFDKNLKSIKSEHYFVFEHETQQPVLGCRSKSKIEVASLTKIMTFYVCVRIAEEFSIDLSRTKVKIDEDVEGFCGTTALLQEGQIYTVQQLLYGLMLPSGNDAAMSLAKWGGALIRKDKQEGKVKSFILKMNEEAQKLSLTQTIYKNPHGLPHKDAQTTCEDVARLCSECLKLPLFLRVVGTKNYKFRVQSERYKRKLLVSWENTNKLLRREGFIGIKTGITVTAGPCLASAYKFKNSTYIVILAKCNKSSRRFKETRKLLVHCFERMKFEEELTPSDRLAMKNLSRGSEEDSDHSKEEKEFDFRKYDHDEMKRRLRIITNHQ